MVSLTFRLYEHGLCIQSENASSHEVFFVWKGAGIVVCEPTCYREPIVVYQQGTVINLYQVLFDKRLNLAYKAIKLGDDMGNLQLEPNKCRGKLVELYSISSQEMLEICVGFPDAKRQMEEYAVE